MTNRKKIENFCKNNNLTIFNLEFIRNTDAIYGTTNDASYWDLAIEMNGIQENYDSFYGYGVNIDVDKMLKEIEYDMREENNE